LEDGEDVLEEVKLLVCRLDREVLADRYLVSASIAEGRVSQDDIVALAIRCLIDRVTQLYVWLHLVQIHVHPRQAAWTLDQLLPVVRRGSDALGGVTIECSACLLLEPLVRSNKEATSATGGVTDGELPVGMWVRLDKPHHRPDERSRREVLTSTLLALCGGLLQESLKGRCLDVDVEAHPLCLIDGLDQPT